MSPKFLNSLYSLRARNHNGLIKTKAKGMKRSLMVLDADKIFDTQYFEPD